jgi:hypothetical protein
MQSLTEAGALQRVADAAALARWVDAMLRDPGARDAMGRTAEAAASRYTDLPDRTAEAMLGLLRRIAA